MVGTGDLDMTDFVTNPLFRLLDLCHSGFICASVYLYIIHGLSDSTSIRFIQWYVISLNSPTTLMLCSIIGLLVYVDPVPRLSCD